MSGNQTTNWTVSRPVTPEYNISMHEFANMSCTIIKQYKDSAEGRMESDSADLDDISSKSVVW